MLVYSFVVIFTPPSTKRFRLRPSLSLFFLLASSSPDHLHLHNERLVEAATHPSFGSVRGRTIEQKWYVRKRIAGR
jgi:hypothetical protein